MKTPYRELMGKQRPRLGLEPRTTRVNDRAPTTRPSRQIATASLKQKKTTQKTQKPKRSVVRRGKKEIV